MMRDRFPQPALYRDQCLAMLVALTKVHSQVEMEQTTAGISETDLEHEMDHLE